MAISRYPASVFLPKQEEPLPTILWFLCRRFPRIEPECWERRISQGKVLAADGSPITPHSPYLPEQRIYYFREVEQEPVIPFEEKIVFQNDQILVCCKPHFLPVTPGGRYVEQCLVHRLRARTGIDDLVPMHRIDRETAGLVLFSTNRATRGLYNRLFAEGKVEKSYLALAPAGAASGRGHWTVQNRLVPGEPWYRMKTEPGEINARSRIELLEVRDGLARFRLTPETGKTHQLRVHLSGLGFPILNDRLYPDLQAPTDNFDTPLQLLAHRLAFRDPLTGQTRAFESERSFCGNI